MDDITYHRLMASKQLAIEEDLKFGRECGQEWANRVAEYDELKRLLIMHNRMADESKDLIGDSEDPACAAVFLYSIISPNEAYGAAGEFWESVFGKNDFLTNEQLMGFAEGALEVWDQFQDHN